MTDIIGGFLLEKRWIGDKDVWQFPPNSAMDLGAKQNRCQCGAAINSAQVVQRCYECLNEAYGFPRVPAKASLEQLKLI